MLRIETIYRLISTLYGKKVNTKILFIHIPKCGGTSIYTSIQESFGFFELMHGRNFFGLEPSASFKSSELVGEQHRDYLEKLLLYFMSKETSKYIYGHFFFSELAKRNFGDRWNYITILRQPVEKWFSQYFYNRYKESDHFKINTELEQFVESETSLCMGRDYINYLTDGVSFKKTTSDAAINQAIYNLDSFSLVGVLERLDLFAYEYEKVFGAKLYIKKRNPNPLSKMKQNKLVSESIFQRVEEICKPNLAIYNSVIQKTS